MPSDEYLWAYGVVPATQSVPAVAGVEDRPVEAVERGDLAALVSTVPSDRFDRAALERRLEDLATLEALARAHARVLDAALDRGTVVPFRMCTIYATRDGVEKMLAAEADRMMRTIAHLRDKAEWGVKVFALPSTDDQRRDAPASGTEYLMRRREEREKASASDTEIDGAVVRIHSELAAAASGAVIARPHDRQLARRDADMVLNGAYLLRREAADDFAALVAGLEQRHPQVELELTGPWPPFHFAGESSR